MNHTVARRVTGVAGLSAAAALIVEVPLYFLYSGPPPDANVLARLLIGMIGLVLLLVFASAFREFVARAAPDHAWAGSLVYAAGATYVGVALVSSGLEAGAVIAAPRPIDPTITVSGTYVLYGTVSRLLLALFLGSLAYVVARAGLLPRWTSRAACVLALVNLAFVPSLFFGNTPAHFYAANGWGTTALMGALFSWFLLALNVSVLRSGARRTRTVPGLAPAA